ncbi:MAG: hypothetical protein ACHQHN_04240 [Sphingobacteriales bacterium]
MKKWNKSIRIAAVTVLLAGCVVLVTLAVGRLPKRSPAERKPAIAKSVERPAVYDSVLLTRFTQTIRSLDFNRRECTYRGIISMHDPGDSLNNVRGLEFLFARSGDDYYYKVGNAEIIHRTHTNLFIQNDQQRVVLSDQGIELKAPMGDLIALEKALQSEHYQLTNAFKGHEETMSLSNEHHISCKELSVTLDTGSHKLQRIYIRLTTLSDPLNNTKDRTVEVHISELGTKANLQQYPAVDDVIDKAGRPWQLTGKYKDYKLIML